jgi:EPS-associated MarR family transcriptional regulator
MDILNNKTTIQEEAQFQILRLLRENPELSQREFSERAGISLSAVNRCLRGLKSRGLFKALNLRRNPNKFGYAYALTPAGIAEKTLLTGRFLKQKLEQYNALKKELETRSAENRKTSLLKGSGV